MTTLSARTAINLATHAATESSRRMTVLYCGAVGGGMSVNTLRIDDQTANNHKEWRKVA